MHFDPTLADQLARHDAGEDEVRRGTIVSEHEPVETQGEGFEQLQQSPDASTSLPDMMKTWTGSKVFWLLAGTALGVGAASLFMKYSKRSLGGDGGELEMPEDSLFEALDDTEALQEDLDSAPKKPRKKRSRRKKAEAQENEDAAAA